MKTPLPHLFRSLLLGGVMTAVAGIAPLSAQNLITNGNFEDSGAYPWGASGYTHPHFTSDYDLTPWYLGTEGSYTIANAERGGPNDRWPINPKDYNYNFRQMSSGYNGTPGMMLVNGAVGQNAAGITVWESSLISIASNTTYEFTAYVTNINDRASWAAGPDGELAWRNSQAILSVEAYLDGTWSEVGSRIDLTSVTDPNEWHGFDILINSGGNSEIKLRLVNQQTAANGNDFALDELSLNIAAPIPEPSTFALLGMVAAATLFYRRKR